MITVICSITTFCLFHVPYLFPILRYIFVTFVYTSILTFTLDCSRLYTRLHVTYARYVRKFYHHLTFTLLVRHHVVVWDTFALYHAHAATCCPFTVHTLHYRTHTLHALRSFPFTTATRYHVTIRCHVLRITPVTDILTFIHRSYTTLFCLDCSIPTVSLRLLRCSPLLPPLYRMPLSHMTGFPRYRTPTLHTHRSLFVDSRLGLQ